MRAALAAWSLAVCVILAGCSTVEQGAAAPSDATSPITIESAARLNQVLLLAPVATCSACGESSIAGGADMALDPQAIASYLRDWKDYEVTFVAKDSDTDNLVIDLATWHEHLQQSEPVPPPLQKRLAALTQARAGPAADGVSGVMIIHSHRRFLSATDVALNLMVVGMPNMYKKLFERNTSIALYEARRGELLWMTFFNAMPDAQYRLQDGILGEMENLPAAARQLDPPR